MTRLIDTLHNETSTAWADIFQDIAAGRYLIEVTYNGQHTMKLGKEYRTLRVAVQRAKSILRNVDEFGVADMLENLQERAG